MENQPISWYAITTDLQLEDKGVINFEGAIKILEQYGDLSTQVFDDQGHALSNTFFGFSRSKSDFIEICIYNPTQISYKFEYLDPEATWFSKVFVGPFQYEIQLDSTEQLLERVKEYFHQNSREIKSKLEIIGPNPMHSF
jgi:hypothetical protein